MGFFTSGKGREMVGGTLAGGEIAPTVKTKLPELTPSKTYKVPVPRDCVAGDEFRAELDGYDTILKVPANFSHMKSTRITHMVRGDDDLIVASTLPTVPGYEIVLSKPVVYGCVVTSQFGVQDLLQQAQDQLTSLAIACNCNAVLGIHFSVTTDGAVPVVFAFGTPCVILEGTSGLPPTSAARGARAGDSVTTMTMTDDEEVAAYNTTNKKKKKQQFEEVKEPEYESDNVSNSSDEDMGIQM